MTKKIALVTGATGQDGSYLLELLLNKEYKVIGLKRRTSTDTTERICHLLSNDNLKIEECEISDAASVYSIVDKYKPDEIYNLAAQSHVKTSFDQPSYAFNVNTMGVLNFLEAIRKFSSPMTRFYQASTSELFGKSYSECDGKKFQNETTTFMPQSPYAIAKLAAHELVRVYREAYGLHASCGILFNHESERRGEEFVTRKITKWAAEFKKWINGEVLTCWVDGNDSSIPHRGPRRDVWIDLTTDQDYIIIKSRVTDAELSYFPKIRLGNLDASRDWGHAMDYVRAMWRMLQQDVPDDYVIATGETHSIRDFLREALRHVGIDNFEPYVVIDPKFYRPAEVEYLCGDSSKAQQKLGWSPIISFEELVRRMVWRDIHGEETGSQAV